MKTILCQEWQVHDINSEMEAFTDSWSLHASKFLLDSFIDREKDRCNPIHLYPCGNEYEIEFVKKDQIECLNCLKCFDGVRIYTNPKILKTQITVNVFDASVGFGNGIWINFK